VTAVDDVASVINNLVSAVEALERKVNDMAEVQAHIKANVLGELLTTARNGYVGTVQGKWPLGTVTVRMEPQSS
jgi:hypothetical protein